MRIMEKTEEGSLEMHIQIFQYADSDAKIYSVEKYRSSIMDTGY